MSNMNCCRVETVPKLKRTAGEAFHSFSNKKRAKKIGRINLGDAVINILSKKYTGTLFLFSDLSGNKFLRLRVGEEDKVVIPCSQILSCNIPGTTATLQFKKDFITEKCTLEFNGKEQADMFEKKLLKIERPKPKVLEVSPDSNFSDSGDDATLRE